MVAIKEQLNIPVKFIGLGETPEDIETFDPTAFVAAMFEEVSRRVSGYVNRWARLPVGCARKGASWASSPISRRGCCSPS